MRMSRIAVAAGALGDLGIQQARFAQSAEFVTGSIDSATDVAELTSGAEALVVSLHPLRGEHLQAVSDSVRVLGRAGVGLDTIDLDAAGCRQLPVIYQPTYATAEVADHTLAMLLAAVRRVPAAHQRVTEGGWPTGPQLGSVLELRNCTAGIIGFGEIGRAVARRLRPFVRNVLAWDSAPGVQMDGVEFSESLEDVLQRSEVVSLHLALNEGTRHIIGASELRMIRSGAVLVNCARGGLIDELALAAALRDSALSAAALDVFEDEPLPPDAELRGAPNVLFSPHIAWYSTHSAARLAEWTVEDALAFLDGRALRHGSLASR